MADFAEQSVQTRIRRLCQCILDESFRTPYECDILLSSLQPPGKNTVWNERRRGKYIRRLSQATFDILLLRKWAWFGSWGGTPLSPLCWCRAYSYGYHTRGREREGKRLCAALDTFSSESCSVLVERDAVLQFLALLAGDINHQQPQMNSSVDSGVFCYDISPRLFEEVPGSAHLTSVSHAIEHSSTLFSSEPGSGFTGFLSSQDLREGGKMPEPSSLFDGLTHSRSGSLNSHLSLPNLPSHPSLLSLLTHTPSPHTSQLTAEEEPSPPPSPSSSSLLMSDLCTGDVVPSRSWEGWQEKRPFLTEAGEEAVKHSLFLSLAHLPLSPGDPPDEAPPSGRGLEPQPQQRGSVEQAFVCGVTRLEQYWVTASDTLHNVLSMERYVGHHNLQPLLSLLSSVQSTSLSGLEIVDRLYTQCVGVQGTPHYPLLLSLLSISLTPYTHFLAQWLFRGWLDEKEEFGIHSNHTALQSRDHRYWTEGYTASEPCTPTFLSRHGHTVLACGKSLNFLRVLQPKHPLCGQEVKVPPIAVATSLETLEALTQQCQAYLDGVLEKVSEDKRKHLLKAAAEEEEAMLVLLEARRRAREAILAVRELEREMENQRVREKHEWLLELQTRASEARLMKMEKEKEERERDREMVAVLVSRDEALTAHERKLAEEARAELVAHYEALGREAEVRRSRAEWREARWRLAGKRRAWMEGENWDVGDEGERWGLGEVVKEVKKKEGEVAEERRGNDDDEATTAEYVLGVEDKPQTNHPETSHPPPLLADADYHNEQGPPPPPVPMVTRGQTPPSTIGDLIHYQRGMPNYTPATAQTQNFMTRQNFPLSRKHAPPTTIQNLLYPLTSEKEATPTEALEEARPTIGEFPCPPPQPYTLSFPQLDEVPHSDILTPVIGPSPPPHGMETDIMLLPLPYLLDHTLSLPLLTQNHLVNSALLDYFLTSCHVTSHFLSLKRFLLLEDGEFAHSLSSQLFNKLRRGGGFGMTSPAFLNPLLQSALDSSLHGNTPNAECLTFAVSGLPPPHPHAVDALDFLQLRYKVEWPCNVVITEDSLRKYNRVFHLLLQLRRASWTLKTVFTLIQQCEGLDKQQKRVLQIHRHEFQHFVCVMEGYITNQLFYLSWKELEEDVANKVHSLDDLIKAHQTFIDKAIFRCLLSKKAVAVMKIIQTVFSCILRFSTTLSSCALPSHLHLFHSLTRTHRKFRETAGLLMKVIIKLVERGYQPHLEDFLLRLNFNNFYG